LTVKVPRRIFEKGPDRTVSGPLRTIEDCRRAALDRRALPYNSLGSRTVDSPRPLHPKGRPQPQGVPHPQSGPLPRRRAASTSWTPPKRWASTSWTPPQRWAARTMVHTPEIVEHTTRGAVSTFDRARRRSPYRRLEARSLDAAAQQKWPPGRTVGISIAPQLRYIL
jgi:hypothetical protein